MSNTHYEIRNVSFVEASDLVPAGWHSFWSVISENAPFSWGDNNRTLVTASDFKQHVESALQVMAPDYEEGETDEDVECDLDEEINYQDYLAFMCRLTELGETYVDLEN